MAVTGGSVPEGNQHENRRRSLRGRGDLDRSGLGPGAHGRGRREVSRRRALAEHRGAKEKKCRGREGLQGRDRPHPRQKIRPLGNPAEVSLRRAARERANHGRITLFAPATACPTRPNREPLLRVKPVARPAAACKTAGCVPRNQIGGIPLSMGPLPDISAGRWVGCARVRRADRGKLPTARQRMPAIRGSIPEFRGPEHVARARAVLAPALRPRREVSRRWRQGGREAPAADAVSEQIPKDNEKIRQEGPERSQEERP